MTELDTTPLTRREIRLAERALAERAEAERVEAHRALVAFADLPASQSAPVAPPLPRRRDLRTPTVPLRTTTDVPARTATDTTCPAPFAVVPAPAVVTSRRELRSAATGPARQARPSRASSSRRPTSARPASTTLAKGVVTLAMSGAFLVSGLSYLQIGPLDAPVGLATAAEVRAAERSEAIAAARHQDRLDQAATDRLTGQAATYAAGRRAQALEVALASLEDADLAAGDAQAVLAAGEVKSLDTARQQLAALVEAAPLPTAAPPALDRTPEVSRSSRLADADAELTASTPSASAPEVASAPAGTDAPADATAAADALVAPDLALLTENPATLDLAVTDRLLAAAARVEKLSLEVRETTQDVLAAKAAARKAAADLQRRVDATVASPNGAIDTDLLCAPDFESDELLRCDAAAALEKLNDAYRADFGRDLDVTSSYRSYSAQVSTRASRGWLAAVPGTSNHGHAVAVDFAGFGGVGDFSSPSYLWMKANAGRFGWVHPSLMEPGGGGPQEPWHWEFGTE